MTRLILIGASLLALHGPAFGQQSHAPGETDETRLETVSVTGFRPLLLEDTTGSVSALDPGDLSVRASPYLADQLRAVPGVSVSRSGGLGGLTQLRLRGAEADHTLFLVDGIEASDPATGQVDFGLWSGLQASRVEIARGEQSVLHGSDAIGGVVRVETVAEAASLHVEGGARDTARANARLGHQTGAGHVSAGVSAFRTRGVDTAGLDGERDGSESLTGWASARHALGRDWQANGLVRYGRSSVETDPDLDFDGRLDDAIRETESDQYLVGGALRGTTGMIDQSLRAGYARTVRKNTADGAFTDETTGARFDLTWSPSVEIAARGLTHRFSALGEFEHEAFERVSEDTLFGDPNQDRDFETYSLAAEYRLAAGPVDINASVRRDFNDDRFEDATSWRLGGAYDLGRAGRVRASLGQGIKNPTFTEQFGFFPGQFVGNRDLQPERSRSIEIGWDGALGPVTLSTSAFLAQLEDEIFTDFNPDFTATARNRDGESERRGVELGADWQVSPALRLSGQASRIGSENEAGADEVRVPDWTASVSLDWASQARAGLRAGLAADYVGAQDDFDFAAFPARRVSLDPYVLVSATASIPITPRLAVTLRGDNLLDEAATDVFGFNTAGAGVFLGVRIR